MFGELINIHREITELITFESAFYFSFTVLTIIWILRYYHRFTVKEEWSFFKDVRRSFLLIIRDISCFIFSILKLTLIVLGLFSENVFVVNIVKLYIVFISLVIIKKTIDIILERWQINKDIR